MRLTVSVDRAGIHHAINLMKPASGGPFDMDDIAMARGLMPHLQRALAIQRRMEHADVTEASAISTLNLLRHAVLLLDEDGRVLHANALAETLLLCGDVLRAKHGILYAATAPMTAALHAVLAAAAARHDLPMRAGSLRLPKPAGGAPLSLLAMPFQQDAHWSLSRRTAILVCIADPDTAPAVPGRWMMELFGLTGAEARLSIELMAGKELRDIALDSGRSINTVRTLLARVMAKTGAKRQSDLVRLMANLPRAGEPARDPVPGTARQAHRKAKHADGG
ncbi:MAG TPA: helix-turn-helix transcriptional regulator [Acetobacteraceae bacterium]